MEAKTSTSPPKAVAIKPFTIIVAATTNNGIGFKNELPWQLKKEMEHFRTTTIGDQTESGSKMNAVIMGRKTWESIPEKYRPLSGRWNIVIGKQDLSKNPDVRCSSLQGALEMLSAPLVSNIIRDIFVIGGASLYAEAILHPKCDRILLTRVNSEMECDRFFPAICKNSFRLTSVSKPISEINVRAADRSSLTYSYEIYAQTGARANARESKAFSQQINLEEAQYLNTIRDVLATGIKKADRTGTGTISKFGHLMRFSLREGRFPLLTTKRVPFKAVAEELFWMLKGSTDAKELSAQNVKIWDANGSRAALDKLGFKEREEGDLGPIYGHQWRHFGSKYTDCKADYKGQGIDQIAEVIRQLKTEPNSRRILFSAWNPSDLKMMSLPPCHVLAQFTVADGFLSCLLYQRSCDLGLGIPFNIAFYSLLTILLADFCGLKPGEFIHTLGDYHVYLNHVEPLKGQLERETRPFPTLRLKQSSSARSDICSYQFDDLILDGYNPHPAIKMEMSV